LRTGFRGGSTFPESLVFVSPVFASPVFRTSVFRTSVFASSSIRAPSTHAGSGAISSTPTLFHPFRRHHPLHTPVAPALSRPVHASPPPPSLLSSLTGSDHAFRSTVGPAGPAVARLGAPRGAGIRGPRPPRAPGQRHPRPLRRVGQRHRPRRPRDRGGI